MKRNILYLFIFISLAFQTLYAQSVSSGSRLNIAGKKKAVSEPPIRFKGMPAALNYKPLSLQNPKALNSFYRTFLFSNAVSSESTAVLATENIDKNADKKVPAVEASLKPDELLYVSDKISISNIYPNPASEYAELDYSIAAGTRGAKLIIYNVLGSQMAELPLGQNERKLRVNTRDMPTGLYFYQLSLDGKKVATKKMLVRHQQ